MPIIKGSLHTAKVHSFAALIAGEQASPLHGDCETPIFIEYQGDEDKFLARNRQWSERWDIDYAPGHGLTGVAWDAGAMQTAALSVRCRKCPSCLKARARLWAFRGRAELLAARRTWFGTLTYRPSDRFRVRCQADKAATDGGSPWHSLDSSEQFKELAKVARRDHQLFLKRVRKQSAARIRYLTVTEAHADGFPHLHVLLHEYDGTCSKRLLEKQWPHGFSKWKLVDNVDYTVPWYVCKYLTKSILAKPLASQRYGQPPMADLTERAHDVARALRDAVKRGSALADTS